MPIPFKVNHLGALDSVTGSCHLLRANGLSILVDCGLAQGRDQVMDMTLWPVKPINIDYLFLTHAHIDHIGRVPDLIDAGFTGEIICTLPTRDLLIPMLDDAMGFTGRSDYAIEKMKSRLDELSWDFEYDTCFDLKNGVCFTLGNAGHILGSCFIRFESTDPVTVWYESDQVFSKDNFGQPIPVFLDSPLGLELTRVYSRLDKFWDGPARRLLAMGDHLDWVRCMKNPPGRISLVHGEAHAKKMLYRKLGIKH